MRKLWVLVVLMSIVAIVGVTVASARVTTFEYRATSLISQCGDQWHESAVFAGGFIQENGVSGTNMFRVTFILQWWDGSKWVNGTSSVFTSNSFPDNSSNYSWRPKDGAGNEAIRVNATPAHQDKYIRSLVQFDWLHLNADGSKTLLRRSLSAGSPYCFAGVLAPPAAARPSVT